MVGIGERLGLTGVGDTTGDSVAFEVILAVLNEVVEVALVSLTVTVDVGG